MGTTEGKEVAWPGCVLESLLGLLCGPQIGRHGVTLSIPQVPRTKKPPNQEVISLAAAKAISRPPCIGRC